MTMEEGMIGYCGNRCHLCAARSDDPAVRQRLIDVWRRVFGHDMYTVDNVCCDGCRGDGRLADENCQARPCVIQRGLEGCAYCDEFVCDKLKPVLGSREGVLVLRHARIASLTEEEYNLAVRPLMNMATLIRMLVRAGKLPSWASKVEQVE